MEEGGTPQASSCTDAVGTMERVVKTLAQANASQRVDLDWEAQNQVHASCMTVSYMGAYTEGFTAYADDLRCLGVRRSGTFRVAYS